MNIPQKLKKQLGRKLTVMLVPHSGSRPIRINLSLAFLLSGLISWTGLTIWSGVIAGRHIDYWRVKSNERLLSAKVWYFSQEVRRARESADRVREAEISLQHLLDMKSRQAIVESDPSIGGPTISDERLLSALLKHPVSNDVTLLGSELANAQMETKNVLANFQDISRYIQTQRDIYRATPMDWPAKGYLSSRFGFRQSPADESPDQREFHRGVDIANAQGTPIHATADGIIRLASWQGGYGRLIVIDHSHGFQTYYAHNAELFVKPGDIVKRGQIISSMGTSGHSTGYHLHYEVWKDGRVVNPLRYIKTS